MNERIAVEFTTEEIRELLAILDFARCKVRIDQVQAILVHYAHLLDALDKALQPVDGQPT
jgi:hypothetical protein